ncbi:hypothetical protein ACI3L1_06790 [Deinococcus sp. SM5_A1]|uniref:hypothetical protein n=1 Tax=Deinococcus sp. SM5_A1 TaxID=3379094 RepID=UPI00385AF382
MPDLNRRTVSDEPSFWRGVAYGMRAMLIATHVLFGIPCIVRQNIPLLFTGYAKFDDQFPFVVWGLASLLAALLLAVVPMRVPWGLGSTMFSAFLFLFIGFMFAVGAGLLPGTAMFLGFGAASGLLFIRSLWFYMIQVQWFQAHVLERTVVRGR